MCPLLFACGLVFNLGYAEKKKANKLRLSSSQVFEDKVKEFAKSLGSTLILWFQVMYITGVSRTLSIPRTLLARG
jgi:hypothetical protein